MSIIVTKDGQMARRIEASGISLEASLQNYIVANPDALPLSDLRDDLTFLIVAREFPTTNGPIDAVGIDDQGHLYLIETKLYRNPDKRRVLAQVMDYGAALWRRHGDAKSFRERLEDAARKCHGKDLGDMICDRFTTAPGDVDAFLAEIEDAVSEGRFRFVVLMDHIDDV